MRVLDQLTPAEVAAVTALLETAAAHDGEQPLNEEATLYLAAAGEVRHLLAEADGRLLGYAQQQLRYDTAQLVVAPPARRRGVGSALLAAVAPTPVWAFGDLPAARSFAGHHGWAPRRTLLVLARDLTAADAAAPSAPETQLRPFAEADADGLLAVNAAAFAWHPEQAGFSRADLDARRAEAWFEPAGLLIAEDAEGVAGFHWTKRHSDGRGEVYILATHPRAQGTGLGKRLLRAGLRHLAASGCREVFLYVDSANVRAVEMYNRAGFRTVHRDVLHGPPSQGEAQP